MARIAPVERVAISRVAWDMVLLRMGGQVGWHWCLAMFVRESPVSGPSGSTLVVAARFVAGSRVLIQG